MERISKELIVRGIGKKISDLRSFQYWAILAKLDEPYRRKNVELVMHRLLQNDLDISTDILKKVDDLRAKIEVQEMPKRIFTAREVHDNLFLQYRSLKKQREEAIDTCNLSTAKNFFVHDGFKKLHSEQEEYEKTLAKIRQREQME